MYVSHRLLKKPKRGATLWRYMDFTKFLALLETQELHLTQLARFDDPFEGHPPRMVIEIHRAMPFGLSEEQYEKLGQEIVDDLKSFQSSRNSVAASCWHLNEVESAAMWSLYLRTGEGIAVKTTFGRLVASLRDDATEVHGALVDYVDFESFYPGHRDPILWATYKRESFAHEREFRLLAKMDPTKTGLTAKVDLSKLFKAVYVAPTVPGWASSLVEKLLIRYGLTCPVIQSTLGKGPAYYGDA
jgi:hypothetical protein